MRKMTPALRGKRILRGKKMDKETIHSGHFMVSEIDDCEIRDDDNAPVVTAHESDEDQHIVLLQNEVRNFDFDKGYKETWKTYRYGPQSSYSISIDISLTKLFETMSLAFSGRLTSPRWKTFKGLKLSLKNKIRLNNIIWRVWHMQFLGRRKTLVCQFASPLDGDTHNKPEAIVMEGKYWKRKLSTVAAEYKKWRIFCKEKIHSTQLDFSDTTAKEAMDLDGKWPSRTQEGPLCLMDDDFLMDAFSDTLFSSLIPNQPFDFPNPREIAAKAGIADLIQPGLLQLQPTVDDIMDTFDPWSDYLMPKLPPLPEEGPDQMLVHDTSLISEVTVQAQNFPNRSSRPSITSCNPCSTYGSSNLEEVSCSPQDRSFAQPSQSLNSIMLDPCLISNEPQLVPLTSAHSNVLMNCTQTIQTLSQVNQGVSDKSSLAVHQQQQQTSQHSPENQVPFHPLVSTCMTSLTSSVRQSARPPGVNLQLPPVISVVQTHPCKQSAMTLSKAARKASVQKETKVLNGMRTLKQDCGVSKRQSFMETHNWDKTMQPPTGQSLKQATAHPVNQFAVPRLSIERMERFRNLSFLQTGSPQLSTQNATSLNNSHIQPPPNLDTNIPCKKSVDTPTNNASTVPLSTVLAQLLTSNTMTRNSTTVFTTVPPTLSQQSLTTSPVTIIGTCSVGETTSPQTFVLSPLTLATVAGVGDVQQRILVGTTTQVLNSQTHQQKVPILTLPSNTLSKNSLLSALEPQRTITENQASPPCKLVRPKSAEKKIKYKEHRRVCHINAEQKRRGNIKNGFDALRHLLPSISQHPNSKVSKAVMLQKVGEYICTLKAERQQQQEEVELLKEQIQELNKTISLCQNQLPPSGAPVPCQRTSKMSEMFEDYVRHRTLQNWKFWIFSMIMEPLLNSYSSSLSTASTNLEEMCKTVLVWLEHHCTLSALRPDPSQLPEEAVSTITKKEPAHQ
ncbi:MLX-interacting protein-like isoform X2 [Limulus polyphemus]|uniref:MLX-interacting protein-like isoform X2 n=1 Tax=Limulus polyphemus TaxID=6850 RepID=A0ABM1S355_LIMPO|nr:MLX-interacting protein-like isoform X2 [Limulus polyphemus]